MRSIWRPNRSSGCGNRRYDACAAIFSAAASSLSAPAQIGRRAFLECLLQALDFFLQALDLAAAPRAGTDRPGQLASTASLLHRPDRLRVPPRRSAGAPPLPTASSPTILKNDLPVCSDRAAQNSRLNPSPPDDAHQSPSCRRRTPDAGSSWPPPATAPALRTGDRRDLLIDQPLGPAFSGVRLQARCVRSRGNSSGLDSAAAARRARRGRRADPVQQMRRGVFCA